MFRKLDLLPSSGIKKVKEPVQLGPIDGAHRMRLGLCNGLI
jgi:hypothetical protein